MNTTAGLRGSAAEAQKTIMNDLVEFIFDGDDVTKEEDDQPVVCPNCEKGCQWTGQSEKQLQFHVCPYEIIECKEQLCATKFERRLVAHHELFCRHTKIVCQTCGRKTNQLDYSNHLERECIKFHKYQRNLSGKWEMFWNCPNGIQGLDEAFKRSRSASLNLLNRQKESKVLETQEKSESLLDEAKEVLRRKIMLLTKEKSLSNPETWSDEKLVKVAKKRRVKIKKKVKVLIEHVRKSYEKADENDYRVHETGGQEKVRIVEREWNEKIEEMEEKLRKRQILAEKRFEVSQANFPELQVGGKKKRSTRSRGGRRRKDGRSKSPSRNTRLRGKSRERSGNSRRPNSRSNRSRPLSKESRSGRQAKGRNRSRPSSRQKIDKQDRSISKDRRDKRKK